MSPDSDWPSHNDYGLPLMGFISALTVNQCIALDIPTILPAGSVHVVWWSKVVPDDTLFIVGDGIPCQSDIHKFIGHQTTQFAAGFRSVVLEISGLWTLWDNLYCYRKNQLTPKLKKLREELLSDLPENLAFVYNKHSVHWAPCMVAMADHIVFQGDSLDMDNDPEMLLKLRWLLHDVTYTQGDWSESPLPIAHQGAASGSCAIISLSSIASYVEPTIPPWSPSKASEFHQQWLSDFFAGILLAAPDPNGSCLTFFIPSLLPILTRLCKVLPPTIDIQFDGEVEVTNSLSMPAAPPNSIRMPAAFPVGAKPTSSNFDSNSNSNSDSSESEFSPLLLSSPRKVYAPTVPRGESRSPSKLPDAPLDPQRPQILMEFDSLEAAVHHVSLHSAPW
ncbi:hypothetical protein DFH08DRAFT_804226 [Mycena albidolilacea]|uniref:Uncharacterized protein n=1 Tax=Mycena albidolilacea TaxID=1033008 RepID=A0AAD7ABI3_9AGAR|nr:hypothetical protein DFH08DRAFT_804226 [Mycena albidolilacea]